MAESELKLNFRSITAQRAEFGSSEDYFQFRFRLLHVSLVVAIAFSGALLLANWLGLNDQGRIHLRSIAVFFAADLLLALYLWGREARFAVVAGLFSAAWFLVNLSALFFLSNNEFRTIWFFVQVMVTYIILGTLPGLLVAALAFVTLVVANQFMPAPFSSNAMVTMLFSLGASSAFLHFYTKRFIAYHRHLTEANELLRDLASHDPLTGVLNARAFNEAGDLLIRSGLRVGKPFSALFIDLDHFKSINDCHGHEAGDLVLKNVATCLAQHTRRIDLLGRIGGEEFLMLLPSTELSGAKLLADKLRQHVEELMPAVGTTRIPVTVSIGVATNRAGHESMEDIRREADQAMYRAKAEGRNRVVSLEDVVPG